MFRDSTAAKLQPEPVEVLVGRQPILDAGLDTCAYELLFRPGGSEIDLGAEGHKATARVVHNALMEIGLDELVGEQAAFINFPRESLLDGVAHLLPPERVVIEILESVTVDEELVAAVSALVDAGFSIALDDFVYGPEWEPLIALADWVKFDLVQTPLEVITEQLEHLRGHDVRLLAEKVETHEQFEQCRELGFQYFQGYFFARPRNVGAKKIPENSLALLQLVARLQEDDVTIDDVEELVSQNIGLSYKLLRYINSPLYGIAGDVENIRQAIVYFGLTQLKHWASVMAMAGFEDKPNELAQTGLIRATTCQKLAEASGESDASGYYLVGALSVLDALADCELPILLERLPLSHAIESALLENAGPMGEALTCARLCEQNQLADAGFRGLDAAEVNRVYLHALSDSTPSPLAD